MQGGVSQIGGLVIYGGLKRKNQRETEIDSSFTTKKYTTISPEHYDIIIDGMERVIKNSNGTAHNIISDDIVICGKTGTAQNPHGEDHSIFIAFAIDLLFGSR